MSARGGFVNEQYTGTDAPWRDPRQVRHANMLLRSFRQIVGRDLAPDGPDEIENARRLYEAPFVLLSHGVEADPILNYGNRQALELWEMNFADFTRMPSRATAEAMLREERERLLAIAARKGFIDDYAGVRISSTGRRFRIENAIIWNVTDEAGVRRGQAATFDRWSDADA
ncbi:MAG: MEKHLA domain-containing protein [Beijerinckiaceae bacterium]